jgi:citrate lyase subunit beta/citryl-CoA lyase
MPERADRIYVRVNDLDTRLTLADLAAVMPSRPDGIVLPKCVGAVDVNRLAFYLDAFEAAAGIDPYHRRRNLDRAGRAQAAQL